MSTSPWSFQMLGAARLTAPARPAVPLERKTAALLAYLALEGPARRAQLTELLWPETREAAARNNLVHLLRKLRAMSNDELIVGGEVLTLTEGLHVDAAVVRAAFMRGEYGDLLSSNGDVLQGLVFDDCPNLDEWVEAQRERLREWRRVAMRADVRALEEAGRFDDALPRALVLLDLDPVSEDAWRRVMRLHLLRGDRPAALRTFQECRETLRRELGVEPLEETTHLARQIENGRVPTVTGPVVAPSLPLTVLRPPVLVGRERQWQQLEEAWQTSRVAFVKGAPGVGKTRLARDFAASKGAFLVNEGRPGDVRQPKSSSARAFQNQYVSAGRPDVPEWVKVEMSRYLPELRGQAPDPPPITNATDLLRFRQAMLEFLVLTTQPFATHIIDDWQYFDQASLEDGVYMFSTAPDHTATRRAAPLICTFRENELSPESEAVMREMIAAGHAVLVDVEPLGAPDVEALLASLGVDVSESVRRGTYRYSGGNPLFLLETVKHLIETSGLAQDFPARLPPPKKVGDIFAQRLARLSPPALQAARAAAVLQSDFDVEQIAEVLGAPLFDVAAAWEELEAAQIMSGNRFSHDLVYEAVEADIPPTVRQLLHRSAARMLENARTRAARVAHHWEAGLKPRMAAPWLVRAAEEALDEYQLPDAVRFFERAAETYEALGERTRAQEAWERHAAVLERANTRIGA